MAIALIDMTERINNDRHSAKRESLFARLKVFLIFLSS